MRKKYPSRYSPNGKVHAAQYITELICEKKAVKDKKELPIKFWKLTEWNRYYRYQIMLANVLLKKYSAKAIIAALMDKKSRNVYSLRSPFLEKLIKEYEHKQPMEKSPQYDIKTPSKFKRAESNKSIISKLKDLE